MNLMSPLKTYSSVDSLSLGQFKLPADWNDMSFGDKQQNDNTKSTFSSSSQALT